jgi:hypothetical protein
LLLVSLLTPIFLLIIKLPRKLFFLKYYFDPVKAMGRKSHYPNHVHALKPMSKEMQPFILANIETVIINNVHVPYAAGFLMVKLGEDVGVKP